MDKRSEENFHGVHPRLVQVMRAAAAVAGAREDGLGFIVIEGTRTKEEQAALVKSGASRTMNSKHLTGHAVDVAATLHGKVRWDWSLYRPLAGIIKRVAREHGLEITWGGDWARFPDGPHFEIDPAKYPMPEA